MPSFCIYIVMKIELCDNFYYRIPNKKIDIYATFNSCKDNVLRNNISIDFYSGEFVKIVQNNYISHIVKPTESLMTIAKKYNTSIEKIRVNNILKNDKLFIGQTIKIY